MTDIRNVLCFSAGREIQVGLHTYIRTDDAGKRLAYIDSSEWPCGDELQLPASPSLNVDIRQRLITATIQVDFNQPTSRILSIGAPLTDQAIDGALILFDNWNNFMCTQPRLSNWSPSPPPECTGFTEPYKYSFNDQDAIRNEILKSTQMYLTYVRIGEQINFQRGWEVINGDSNVRKFVITFDGKQMLSKPV